MRLSSAILKKLEVFKLLTEKVRKESDTTLNAHAYLPKVRSFNTFKLAAATYQRRKWIGFTINLFIFSHQRDVYGL